MHSSIVVAQALKTCVNIYKGGVYVGSIPCREGGGHKVAAAFYERYSRYKRGPKHTMEWFQRKWRKANG